MCRRKGGGWRTGGVLSWEQNLAVLFTWCWLYKQTKYESNRIMETCTRLQKVTEARHCVAGSDFLRMSLRDHCMELR